MKRVLEQALVVAPVAPYFPASHARQSSAVGPEASVFVEKRPAAQSPEQVLVVAPAAPSSVTREAVIWFVTSSHVDILSSDHTRGTRFALSCQRNRNLGRKFSRRSTS